MGKEKRKGRGWFRGGGGEEDWERDLKQTQGRRKYREISKRNAHLANVTHINF